MRTTTCVSSAVGTQTRTDRGVPSSVMLNEVLRESMSFAHGRIKRYNLDEFLGELPSIMCFRGKIGQVIINLLVNASDALDEKSAKDENDTDAGFRGQISISSETCEREGKTGVMVSISDNGDGVPEDIREKIFEQFYTTKPDGSGIGLGLFMCAGIVKEHGGVLNVTEDETLGGARFEVWLPKDAVTVPSP